MRASGTFTEMFDVWFADDGQAWMRPERVESFLQSLDQELHAIGCRRGTGSEVKSSVTLIGHPDAIAGQNADWVTERIRQSCKILEANGALEVLGACVGTPEDTASHFHDAVAKLEALHIAIEGIGDPAAELTLGRNCADISRVNHLLRTSGDRLAAESARDHDDLQRAFMVE